MDQKLALAYLRDDATGMARLIAWGGGKAVPEQTRYLASHVRSRDIPLSFQVRQQYAMCPCRDEEKGKHVAVEMKAINHREGQKAPRLPHTGSLIFIAECAFLDVPQVERIVSADEIYITSYKGKEDIGRWEIPIPFPSSALVPRVRPREVQKY